MTNDLHYLDLVDVGQRIKAGALSPVALTETMLARIEKLDGGLKSYATVTADLARSQAREAEAEIKRGAWRGPLHGVPIAVKDLCYTRGIPTAAGMAIHKDFKPDHDSTVVERFAQAGAVLLGKLQLTEGAFADHHPSIPPPVNPWNKDYWSGASSSGSGVATASGLCFASLGSDTGGSIRFPSAANGVTGLKPTWGRVSRYGVFALAESLDHIGPMTQRRGCRGRPWCHCRRRPQRPDSRAAAGSQLSRRSAARHPRRQDRRRPRLQHDRRRQGHGQGRRRRARRPG